MVKALRVPAASVTVGFAALSLAAPTQADNCSAVGAGFAGLGTGASPE